MIRHKLRKGIVRSSVFLASQHWQYSGNGFHRLNQVYLILICAYGESFVTFIIFHLQIKRRNQINIFVDHLYVTVIYLNREFGLIEI